MKNVLILSTVSGFLDKFEKNNVAILQKMGYTVHYASNMSEQYYLFEPEKIRSMGVHLHHIDIARSPYMLQNYTKALFQLKRIIKEHEICAIHCHEPVGGVLGRLAGGLFRKEKLHIIYTAHGFHFYKGAPLLNNTIYYLAEKMLAHFTDILVVINKEDYKNARKLRLKQGGRIYRIPGVGLDLDKFSPFTEEEKLSKRKALRIKDEDCFFVSVGELNENKNQEVILKALAELRRRGVDIRRLKYGICGEGFFRKRITAKIQELHLEKNVMMFGYRNDVREILGCADFSVFPSRREGLGMAGLEALAMGLPLLAADNRGTREYMQHGINGFFCDSDNVQEWADSIQQMWKLTKETQKEMKTEMRSCCRNSVVAFEKRRTDAIMKLVYEDLDERVSAANCSGRQDKVG